VVALPAALPAGAVQLEITGIEPGITLDRRYAEPVVLPAAISEIDVGSRTVVPDRLDTGCRDDLVAVDGAPVPVRVEASVADLLAGEPVPATICGDEALTLAAGTHRLTTTDGATTGIDVDRVVLADPSRQSGPPTVATGPTPTVEVRAQGRTSRDVTVDGCPDGCWLVLGEGYHDAWSASTAAGDLGPPQLVDGGFNGWWIPPGDEAIDVAIRWTAQTPLTIALVLTVLSVLGCLVLIAVDRRHTVPLTFPPARLALGEPPVPVRQRVVAAAAWVVAAGLLVGPGWALVAAVASMVLLGLLGRPRLAGYVTIAILAVVGVVIAYVVRTERPWPDAGWPVRFEWLHGLGLFAAVSLLVTIVGGWRRRPVVTAGSGTPAGPARTDRTST
jgi:arabinofuranan 3-O-arabinosyltransferase